MLKGHATDTEMKPSQLECELHKLRSLPSPKSNWEQYGTPPHIAAHVLWEIHERYDDFTGKTLLDLGCGCGILGIGSLILGAKFVLAIDVDEAALEVAKQNAVDLDISSEKIDFLQQDVSTLNEEVLAQRFDIAMMNPPFGTKNQLGIDVIFVEKALELSDVVYSMHKSSTRAFLLQKGRCWNVTVKPLTRIRFNLEKSYKFHKKETYNVDVDLLQFKHV